MEDSLSAERNDGAERTTFMQESKGATAEAMPVRKRWVYTGVVVVLRGRNTSSTLLERAQYVGTDVGGR